MKEIPLTKGKVALVDDIDYPELSKHKWFCHHTQDLWYAKRSSNTIPRQAIAMHRVICNAPADMQVDHIDGNGLNNRRSNLRLCTNSQNSKNCRQHGGTSLYKGVSFEKRNVSRQWRASIKTNSRALHLGYFRTEIEAAEAYDKAAQKLWGEFARLNLPLLRDCLDESERELDTLRERMAEAVH